MAKAIRTPADSPLTAVFLTAVFVYGMKLRWAAHRLK